MIVYNIAQYIRTELPGETVYINTRQKLATQGIIPDRNILIMITGGSVQAWVLFNQPTFQILVRDKDSPKALILAEQIFDLFKTSIGLIVPAVTVDSVVYPAVQLEQISAIQKPSLVGADDQGRIEYTTNYIVYKKE